MHRNRNKLVNYSCIRCGYSTSLKSDMRRHLYKKNTCPATINEIELTDEIKTHILDNRIYHIPKPKPKESAEKQTFNIINYNNIINNMLINMDPHVKMEKLCQYTNTKPIAFDLNVDLMFEKHRSQLENNVDHQEMTKDDLFEIINLATSVDKNNIEKFNLLYDNKLNKCCFYEGGVWKSAFIHSTLKKIINTIQDYFWNAYECYLIRKLNNTTTTFHTKNKIKERLIEYYKFIGSIEVDPFVKDRSNNKIMYTMDEEEYFDEYPPHETQHYTLCDEYYKLYKTTQNNLTLKQSNDWKNKIVECVKSNCKNNVSELNKLIMGMMDVDDEFKQSIMRV